MKFKKGTSSVGTKRASPTTEFVAGLFVVDVDWAATAAPLVCITMSTKHTLNTNHSNRGQQEGESVSLM